MTDYPPDHSAWLERFFAAPNGLGWDTIVQGTVPSAVSESLGPWLNLLRTGNRSAPVILPFVRDGAITGWYAAAQDADRTGELDRMLGAWFGMTWLSRFDRLAPDAAEPMAAALRTAFGTRVFRFAGADPTANRRIASDLATLAQVIASRPERERVHRRPVGVIRAEFDRALLVRDQTRAQFALDELKQSGRLNDENLRYLDVRMRAGLGLWPQIAHDHWLIRTLSELVLPPQIIADLIEALYRTHLDGPDPSDSEHLLASFSGQIGDRYPRLFSSRRGVRTPRVVKAFLLHERARPNPNRQILDELIGLLPDDDPEKPAFAKLIGTASATSAVSQEEADNAFDDGDLDRAFEFYLVQPASKKSLTRLILCATLIGTPDAIARLATKVDGAGVVFGEVSATNRTKYEALQQAGRSPDQDVIDDAPLAYGIEPEIVVAPVSAAMAAWEDWISQIRTGHAVGLPEAAAVSWDTQNIVESEGSARQFADVIGNAGGASAFVVRHAIPTIYSTFLSDAEVLPPSVKPIAHTLFMLIAMDDGLSAVDLTLLSQLLGLNLNAGVSADEYLEIIDALSDVQERMSSPAHLAWALDVAEALAIAPAPTSACVAARQQFFLLVVTKAAGFAHRLRAEERQAFRVLTRDFALDRSALGVIDIDEETAEEQDLPDLSEKTVGIYTLTEAAGARAKHALEAMFPGLSVVLNADRVATSKLTNLARTADLFVFAWRSSSHSAFYCIKDAMGARDPIMAAGKGTASIVRAVIDAVQ